MDIKNQFRNVRGKNITKTPEIKQPKSLFVREK